MIRAALLLLAALASYGWFLRAGRGGRRTGHRFARPAWRLFAAFGTTGFAVPLLLGRSGAVGTLPAEFAPARRLAADWTGMPAPVDLPIALLIASMTVGGILAGLIARWRRRQPATLGNVGALMPRRPGELGWGVLLSVDAGVCEELYFRLALPLLVALAVGSAVAGFALSAALFGWAHRYQGPIGVVATTGVALLLSAAYLLTGQLWVAMALHVALDLNGLVVRPAVAGSIGRVSRAPGSRS